MNKKKLTFLIAIVLISMAILTVKNSLARDAELLANLIAERLACGITPAYLGYDGIAGRYDFDLSDQQKFRKAYERYLAAAENRILEMGAGEREKMCDDVRRNDQIKP